MEPMSFMSPVLAGRVFTPKASWESLKFCRGQQKLLSPLSLFVLVYFSILPFSGPAVHDSIILEKYKIATLYFKSIPWFFQLHRKSLSLFILSRVISPLISSSIRGTYRPGEFIFQYLIFLPFILFMGFSRQEHWRGLPFTVPFSWVLVHKVLLCPPNSLLDKLNKGQTFISPVSLRKIQA